MYEQVCTHDSLLGTFLLEKAIEHEMLGRISHINVNVDFLYVVQHTTAKEELRDFLREFIKL